MNQKPCAIIGASLSEPHINDASIWYVCHKPYVLINFNRNIIWKPPWGSRLNGSGRLITGWCGCMGLEANLRHPWRTGVVWMCGVGNCLREADSIGGMGVSSLAGVDAWDWRPTWGIDEDWETGVLAIVIHIPSLYHTSPMSSSSLKYTVWFHRMGCIFDMHSQCHCYHRRLAKQWKKRYIMHNSKFFTTTPLPCCCSHLNSPTPASDTTPPSTTKNGFFCVSTHHEYIFCYFTVCSHWIHF